MSYITKVCNVEKILTNIKTIRSYFAVTSSELLSPEFSEYTRCLATWNSFLRFLVRKRVSVCACDVRGGGETGGREEDRKAKSFKIIFTPDNTLLATNRVGIISICLTQTDFIPRNSASEKLYSVPRLKNGYNIILSL